MVGFGGWIARLVAAGVVRVEPVPDHDDRGVQFIPKHIDHSVTWPVEMFFVFDDAQVNVELVSGFLSVT
jgi:hypothetical protein